MEKTVATLDELGAFAGEFVRGLRPRTDSATLITLSGELGAGKTAFTKAAASALGVDEHVTSPTFVLEKIYRLPDGSAFKRLVHIDAYRLEKGDDLAPLAFDSFMKDSANLVLLEWPEKVASALPVATHTLSFLALADGSRRITYA